MPLLTTTNTRWGRARGVLGYRIVRFRGRYYAPRRYMQYMHLLYMTEAVIESIPADPKGYQQWLGSMRAEYAAKESALETHVHTVWDNVKPDSSQYEEFETLPSELPQLNERFTHEPRFYIINLDQEILTLEWGIHWKLGNLPRSKCLYYRGFSVSLFPCDYTIRFDMCPEEYLASPALELPKPNWAIEHDFRRVTPKTDLVEPRKAFLICILVQVLERYRATIANIGREWCPDSFPFREMAFAIVSIASGQALLAPQQQLDRNGGFDAPGLLNEWANGMPPLLEFGSMSHQPGKPPGVSPTETMYWLNGVLVSLVLVIDGDAFTKAVAWGMEKGRSNFRIVIMTLFGVAFGEVEGSQLKISDPIYFSPLRAEYSPHTHQPSPLKLVKESELKNFKKTYGDKIRHMYNKGTIQHLQSKFTGLVALVNFFEAAANCHAASNSRGRLPVELYDRILDFVDCETWKNCSLVSYEMRESCLRKYRVDDWTAVAAGPLREYDRTFALSFDFEDLRTGKIFPVVQSKYSDKRTDACWAPLIGGDQKALMLESPVYFNLACVA